MPSSETGNTHAALIRSDFAPDGVSRLPDDLVEAYRTTNYEVFQSDRFEGFVLRIGRASPELLGLMKKYNRSSAAYITAWNPLGMALAAEENLSRNEELRQELTRRSLPHWAGQGKGTSGEWPGEDSFLILGMDLAAAVRLANDAEQNAFVWVDKQGTPELVLLK